jgi:Leucine-rich repeat (LRR) protein
MEGTRSGPVIIPGDPELSTLYELISLDKDDPDLMPPKSDGLTTGEIKTIRTWIAEGASFGDWVGSPAPGAEPESAAKPKPKPSGKLPRIILLYMELGEGLNPHTEEQIKLAEGERGKIQPVFPGSPLISAGFPSNQGRTGTADVRGLLCCAENVAALDLGRTRITDEALAAVSNMPRLVKLDLRQTNITDVGISHLAGLDNLRSLNLFSTKVTDASVDTIAKLKRLETVYLWQAKLSAAGVKRLRDLRPDLRVVHQADLPAPERGGGPDDEGDGSRRRRR